MSFCFYLCDFIHKARHYPPIDYQPKEEKGINNLEDYFALEFAHCSHKPRALKYLLEYFQIKSKVYSYMDILGWSHGFIEVNCNGKWYILDPTFNMYMNVCVIDIITNPYCERKVLSLYSDEFYVDDMKSYQSFIKNVADSNYHTTFKYNREWFMFVGFYPYVAPIFRIGDEEGVLYDIQKDTRYELVADI